VTGYGLDGRGSTPSRGKISREIFPAGKEAGDVKLNTLLQKFYNELYEKQRII
jgi:hypothetical protein